MARFCFNIAPPLHVCMHYKLFKSKIRSRRVLLQKVVYMKKTYKLRVQVILDVLVLHKNNIYKLSEDLRVCWDLRRFAMSHR
jgi:hypothetical protein